MALLLLVSVCELKGYKELLADSGDSDCSCSESVDILANLSGRLGLFRGYVKRKAASFTAYLTACVIFVGGADIVHFYEEKRIKKVKGMACSSGVFQSQLYRC